MNNKIIKFILTILTFLLLGITSSYSQTIDYKYLQIPVNIEGKIIQSPYFLYVKHAFYQKKVKLLSESLDLREQFAYTVWQLFKDSDLASLHNLTLSKDEKSLSFIQILMQDFGNDLSDSDIITERYDIGNVSVFVLKIVDKDAFYPLIIKHSSSGLTIDFEAQMQPIFQLLPNLYRYPEDFNVSLNVNNNFNPKYSIKLPIYGNLPDVNPAFLCFDAHVLHNPVKSTSILSSVDSIIKNEYLEYSSTIQNVKKSFHSGKASSISNSSLENLLENFNNIVKDKSDTELIHKFIQRFLPDHPVRFIVSNENIAYIYVMSEEGTRNKLYQRTLCKIDGEWKLVNMFTGDEIYDRFSTIPEVYEQFLLILEKRYRE